MIPIHPIQEESCRPHYGHPVLVVMNDGAQHVGILSRFEKGRLVLNDFAAETAQTENRRSKKRKASVKGKAVRKSAATTGAPVGFFPTLPASISAPFPYSPFPFAGPNELDAANVSMLFLVGI